MSKEPRGLIWDIEATNLSAPFGTVLCIGWKWSDKPKVYVPTILDYEQKGGKLSDKALIEEFTEEYNKADYSVTHYGTYYDLPMISTKRAKYKLPPLAPVKMIDTWKIARYKLKMHSNRLNALAQYFGTKSQKTEITFDDWLGAAAGDKKSIKQVKEHCYWDILTLEEVFNGLKPLVTDMPSQQHFGNHSGIVCENCGSDHIIKSGFKVTKVGRYQRYACQNCGHWQMGGRVKGQAE
jgi:uncharacterized protein YprB with RNaseH-like and TPR domain/predicted RNA-binding Zn-ribbon protein involved in translation (DUF1610 family)